MKKVGKLFFISFIPIKVSDVNHINKTKNENKKRLFLVLTHKKYHYYTYIVVIAS